MLNYCSLVVWGHASQLGSFPLFRLGRSRNLSQVRRTVCRHCLVWILLVVSLCLLARPGAAQGTVWAWGYNRLGELGNGTTTNSTVPVQVTGLAGVVGVAGGGYHCLAVKSDGTVWAWGDNDYGGLGNGTAGIGSYSSVAVQATGLSGVVGVAAGNGHSIAVKSDGTVWTWGCNISGQLGNGTFSHAPPYGVSVPVQVIGLSGIVGVAAGQYHCLAVKNDGTVWAWGYNDKGQLGNGTTTDSSVPVRVRGISGVVEIAGGSYHSIAIKTDGTVWAWGINDYGGLGNGTTTNSSVPVKVKGISGVLAIAGGWGHSIALTSDGMVWAWGYNYYGELGTGTTANSSVPVQVKGLARVVGLASGFVDTSMAVKSDGTLWAWGLNDVGQLGNGTMDYNAHSVPGQVTGLSGLSITVEGGRHSLAIVGPAVSTGRLVNFTMNPTTATTPGVPVTAAVTSIGQFTSMEVTCDARNITGSPPHIALTQNGSQWTATFSSDFLANAKVNPLPLIAVGTRPDGTTVTKTANITNYQKLPALGLNVSGNTNSVQRNQTVTFSGTAYNTTGTSAGLAAVVIRLPSGVSYQSATGLTYNSTTRALSWSGSLPKNVGTYGFTFKVQVNLDVTSGRQLLFAGTASCKGFQITESDVNLDVRSGTVPGRIYAYEIGPRYSGLMNGEGANIDTTNFPPMAADLSLWAEVGKVFGGTRHMKLWFQVTAHANVGGGSWSYSNDVSPAAWLGRHDLIAPSVSPVYHASFNAVHDAVDMTVDFTNLAMVNTFMDALANLISAGTGYAPPSPDTLAAAAQDAYNKVDILKHLGDRYHPPPTTFSGWTKAVTGTAKDLAKITGADELAVKTAMNAAFGTDISSAFDSAWKSVTSVATLLETESDLLVWAIQTGGQPMHFHFEAVP